MRLAPAVLMFALSGTALSGAAVPATAQVAVPAGADARQRPAGGEVLASIAPRAKVSRGESAGDETLVTIEGWVDAARLGGARDSFPAVVSGRLTLRMRAQPDIKAAIVATLQPGVGLHIASKRGTWTQVRRALWVPTSALAGAPAGRSAGSAAGGSSAAATRVTRPAGASASATPPVADRGIVAATGASLHGLPLGPIVGGVSPGSAVEIIGRQPGWVRIRSDGWVPDKDILAGDTVALPAVRAADLRADPQGMKGRIVQWEVEVMAFQTADPLRVEMSPDEPYLLARGPGAENAVLYLAIPPNLLADARAIPPLARVAVTARVRSGRSEPTGTPILDLLTIVRR